MLMKKNLENFVNVSKRERATNLSHTKISKIIILPRKLNQRINRQVATIHKPINSKVN